MITSKTWIHKTHYVDSIWKHSKTMSNESHIISFFSHDSW